MEIEAPCGTRDPIVVHSGNEARAVLIVLTPGQRLGDHQVKENAWMTVLEGASGSRPAARRSRPSRGCSSASTPTSASARERRRRSLLLLLAPWPGDGHYRGSRRLLGYSGRACRFWYDR